MPAPAAQAQAREPVSWMEKLRTVFVCLTLEVGILFGVPMKPEEIQRLLRDLNETTLAQTLPEEKETGEP
jgi:hypothetical protein